MRRAAKVDANQAAMVLALRTLVGEGCPDWAAGLCWLARAQLPVRDQRWRQSTVATRVNRRSVRVAPRLGWAMLGR